MNWKAVREEVNHDAEHYLSRFLSPDKHGGWVCPVCGNGSGNDGTGLTRKDSMPPGFFTCFKCGKSRSAFDWLAICARENPDDNSAGGFRRCAEAVARLCGLDAGGIAPLRKEFPSSHRQAPQEQAKPLDAKMIERWRAALQDDTCPGAVYLLERGVLGAARRMGLGFNSKQSFYNGTKKHFSGGVVVVTSPCTYEARNIDPTAIGSLRHFKKGRQQVFNREALSLGKPVFVCEGFIDALSIIEVGGVAISAGGTAGARYILQELDTLKEPPPVIIAFDADDAGRKAAEEMTKELDKRGLRYLVASEIYGEAKDANDALVTARAGLEKAVRDIVEEAATLPKILPPRTVEPMKEMVFPDVMDGKPITKSWRNIDTVMRFNGWTARENLVSKSIDLFHDGEKKFVTLDTYCTMLIPELARHKLTQSFDAVARGLSAAAEFYRYSPVCDFLNDCKGTWDGVDHIGAAFDCLKLSPCQDERLARILFRRWLIYAAKTAYNNDGQTKGQGVLVLKGRQGLGKTRYLERLIPDKDWFADGQTLDPSEKDSIMRCCGVWVCELGELGDTLRKEKVDKLKAFFTSGVDLLRKPFAKFVDRIPRRTAFCASVNDETFLKDRSGNRRYWVIELDSIDEKPLDLRQLWAQVMYLAFEEKERHWLNDEELDVLNGANKKFESLPPEEQALIDRLDWDSPYSQQMTAAEVCERLGFPRTYTSRVGRALGRLAKEYPDKVTPPKSNHNRQYTLPPFIKIIDPPFDE